MKYIHQNKYLPQVNHHKSFSFAASASAINANPNENHMYSVIDELATIKGYLENLFQVVLMDKKQFDNKYNANLVTGRYINVFTKEEILETREPISQATYLITEYKKVIDAVVEYESIDMKQALDLSNYLVNVHIKNLMTPENHPYDKRYNLYEHLKRVEKLLAFSNLLSNWFSNEDDLYLKNNMLFRSYHGNILMELIDWGYTRYNLSEYEKTIDNILSYSPKSNFLVKNNSAKNTRWTMKFLEIVNRGGLKQARNAYTQLVAIPNHNREFLIEEFIKHNKVILNKDTYRELVSNNDRVSDMGKIYFNKMIIDNYLRFKDSFKSQSDAIVIPLAIRDLFNLVIGEQINLTTEFIENNKFMDVRSILEEHLNNMLPSTIEDIPLRERFVELLTKTKKLLDKDIHINIKQLTSIRIH